MAIKLPIRFEDGVLRNAKYVTLYDASDRAIAGGLTAEDAEEIVNALNAQPNAALNEIEAALISIADGMPPNRAVEMAFDVINRERLASV